MYIQRCIYRRGLSAGVLTECGEGMREGECVVVGCSSKDEVWKTRCAQGVKDEQKTRYERFLKQLVI